MKKKAVVKPLNYFFKNWARRKRYIDGKYKAAQAVIFNREISR